VDYHLIGKDILTTHAVYWPTMLMAAELPLPRTIFAHGWWLVGETKMSKSLGNVVRPLDLADKYGVDALRYYLMREMTPGQDASFTEENFIQRYNSDLANDLGNLVNRVTKLVGRHFENNWPVVGEQTPEDADLMHHAIQVHALVAAEIDKLRINYALQHVLEVLRQINRYLEDQAPWKVVKTDKGRAGTILYNAAEALRLSAGHLYPVMPDKIGALLEILGSSAEARLEDENWFNWGAVSSGTAMGKTSGLFPRIEIRAESEEEVPGLDLKPQITFDEFQKLDIRMGRIIQAEKHPNADKLLKLQVDLGAETRQIIAGIAEWFQPEQLVGETIAILANLKPAKIRGERSQGMLLAAEDERMVAPLRSIAEIAPGSSVR